MSNDGFQLIWHYWYEKYIQGRKKSVIINHRSLAQLQQYFHIQTIDPQMNQQQYEDKIRTVKHKAMLSLVPSVYIINPQQQAKQIQSMLGQNSDLQQQLYSYYFNNKNIYVIYQKQQFSIDKLTINHDNNSEGHYDKYSRALVRDTRTERNHPFNLNSAQLINQLLLGHQDDSLECRNQSIIDSFDKIQYKIQGLQLLDKFSEHQGFDLWNCRYKQIPHTFFKIKKIRWQKSISLPLLHPVQPICINQLPILPKIVKFRPGVNKLLPFVSYMNMLEQNFPNFMPNIDSIYEFNDLAYVFSKQDQNYENYHRSQNLFILCYYVVYGDQITLKQLKRWIQNNSETLLAQTITKITIKQKQKQKFKNKKKKVNNIIENQSDNEGLSIW